MDSPATSQQRSAPGHVAQLVSLASGLGPDHPAIVDVTSGSTLTWAELDAAVDAEAVRLRSAGAAVGARVLVRLGNSAAFCVAVLGALRAGAVAVPFGPIAVARELRVVLEDCHPAVVVATEGDEAARLGAAAAGAVVVGPPDLAARAGGPVDAAGGGEELALLVYTTSTTGVPRGVRLSHRAVLANRAQAGALRPPVITPADRVLLALPLSHVFGLAAGFLQVCWAGATAVLTDDLDPAALAEVLGAHRVSGIAAVPSLYRALLDLPAEQLLAATRGVRICTSGGAPLAPQWLERFQAATGLPIFEGYGLSEAGPVVASTVVGGVAKPGSVGRPLPGVEMRLIEDEDDDDEEGGDGTGLVAVKGENLFSGYWPDGSGGPDPEGWFVTADIGFLDDDGDLHLVDRSTDVVNVSGFNVYPREVERVLVELAGVAEAAVVGVPDDRTGEAVRAVVVRADGVDLGEDEVRAHCVERLARFKVPAVISFVAALPRTPTGKVARRQLAS